MKSRIASVILITSAIAAIIAIVVTIAIPTAYFSISYQYMEGSMDAQAELTARSIEGLVMANPEMWRFEEIRLQELLQRKHNQDVPEIRVIRDIQGNIVAEVSEPLSRPLITRGYDIYDAGFPAARVELSRSFEPLIRRTGIVGSISFFMGFIIFAILRTIPLKAVRKAHLAIEKSEQSLRESRDFLEAVLETAPA
jgi:hypothetical protein